MSKIGLERRSNSTNAFSLTEVVIALGIMSFAIIALLGLLLLGIKDARESEQQTIASMIQRDAATRIREFWQYLDSTPLPPIGSSGSHTFYYSGSGVFLGDKFTSLRTVSGQTALYLATVNLVPISAASVSATTAATTGITAGQLAALTITIQWPLDNTGKAIGTQNSISFVTYVAKNTDPAWNTGTTFAPRP